MFTFKLANLKKNRAKIDFDGTDTNLNYIFNKVRDSYASKNPNIRYQKHGATFLHQITPTGMFPIGLTLDIIKKFKQVEPKVVINLEEPLLKLARPINLELYDFICANNFKYVYRDYQRDGLFEALKNGRGIILHPTGAGKSLVISGLINNIRFYCDGSHVTRPDLKTVLILVPTIQLVTQMYKDFEEYGDDMSDIQMFSGFSKVLDKKKRIVIANRQYVDKHAEELPEFDIVIVDECHGLGGKENNVSKYVKGLSTAVKFGLTGTLPDDAQEQYNIIGILGPVLHEKKVVELQKEEYISNIAIFPIKLIHSNKPEFKYKDSEERKKAYPDEWHYIEEQEKANKVIVKIAEGLKGNTLIITDHLAHNRTIYNLIERQNSFIINGSTELENREDIRKIMEMENDVILVANSACFQLGINIKNIKNIILTNGGKSLVRVIQSIGRGLRLHEAKEKLTLIDIFHNFKYSEKHHKLRIKLYKRFYEKTNLKTTDIQL